jgi:hypothetical protein
VKRYAMDMFGIYLPDANEQIGMLWFYNVGYLPL